MATMKALRYHGAHDLRLEDIPVPDLKSNQVKVKPAWVGICGTDLHEYLEGPVLCPSNPHPLTGEKVPITLGHEFSGVVEAIGNAVKSYKIGDRVVIQPIIYDGTCGACRAGQINCCYSNGFIGLSGFGGGLADYIVVGESFLHHLPDSVPLDIGAMVEPLAVAWHAVDVGDVKPSDSVLILGSGPIGLALILCLRARGISNIIVSEVAEGRKQFALDFGASHVFDPTKEDVAAKCREVAEGQGVHVAFDAAGVQAGLDTAVEAVRARGVIVNVAVWGNRASIDMNKLVFKERSLKTIATYVDGDFQAILKALSEGKIEPKKMITKRIELDQVESEGFKALIEDKANQVKVLVKVAGGA